MKALSTNYSRVIALLKFNPVHIASGKLCSYIRDHLISNFRFYNTNKTQDVSWLKDIKVPASRRISPNIEAKIHFVAPFSSKKMQKALKELTPLISGLRPTGLIFTSRESKPSSEARVVLDAKRKHEGLLIHFKSFRWSLIVTFWGTGGREQIQQIKFTNIFRWEAIRIFYLCASLTFVECVFVEDAANDVLSKYKTSEQDSTLLAQKRLS